MSESAAMVDQGPITRGAAIQGLIDNVEPGRLFGWAWNQANPNERLQIELRLGPDVAASTTASSHRPDLAGSGIGDGRHAFDLPLTPSILERRAEISVVAISENGETMPLPIRRARRPPVVLTPVAPTVHPGTGQPKQNNLGALVRSLTEQSADLQQRFDNLVIRVNDEASTTSAGMAELAERVATLEMRSLAMDDQLAHLQQNHVPSGSPARRRLDPWQIALCCLVCFTAGGALAWSLAGITSLILGR